MTAVRAVAWRLRPHALLAAVAGGLAAAPAGWGAVAMVAMAVGAASLVLAPRWAGAVLVMWVLIGALAGEMRLGAIDRPAAQARPGAAIHARAVVLERPRPGAFGSSVVMRLENGLRVLARFGGPAGVDVGERLLLRGFVRRPRPPADGFDYDGFLRSRGVLVQIQVTSAVPAGRRGGPAGVVDHIRARAERALAQARAPERAALARGMVLGQDEAIDDGVREDFRRSGLAHLLAASGQNVMLLCALALPLLSLAGLRHRGRALTLIALIALYVPLAGAGASIVRAGIMGAAGIVAMLAGRPSSRLYALLLAAVITLAWNPRVSCDPGWQLSFAAVAGIAAGAGPLRRALARRLPEHRAARAVADGLAVTLAATAATAPLTAHHFGAVSLAALPANLLALPAVAPVMWIGMVQSLLGQAGAPGLALAGALATLQDPLLAWTGGVAAWLAEPAWAQPGLALSGPGVIAAFALLAAAAVGLRRLRPPEPHAPRLGTTALVPACALIAALALWAGAPPPPPKGFRADFIDVGQGDATLVRDGPRAAVLFDGGPPEAHVARVLRRLGVRRLTAVVATHQSRDHHGGLDEVLRRFPVGLLLDGGDGTSDPTFRAMLRTARERGVRRVAATAGLRLRAGALAIRVVAPEPRAGAAAVATGTRGGDPNARAVVALVESRGFRLLLSADAESPSLLPLDLPVVHALKVPHHGSSDPGLPRLLARLRPQIAAIEVGARNSYGHPAPSTLSALRRAVPRVYRTDLDGTVAIELHGGRAVVRTGR